MPPTKIPQYAIGKEQLYFFYRFILLRWEVEWSKQKFLVSRGELREFCQRHGFSIKSFESAVKLSEAIKNDYPTEAKESQAIFWFIRRNTKPKDILMHLRHCFAHGRFTKRQKNRQICVDLENFDRGVLKAKGYIPVALLKGFVAAAASCQTTNK